MFLLLLGCKVTSNSLGAHGLQAFLSLTVSQSLLKFMSIEFVMLSKHLILSCPPAFNLSLPQGLFQ